MESTGLKHAAISRVSGLLASLDLIAKASAQLLHPSSDLQTILPTILEIAQSLVAADAYAVWRACPDKSWDIIAASGLSQSYRSQRITASAHPIPRHAVAITDVLNHELVEARRKMYRSEGISSLIVAPLLSSDEVIGTLTFYFHNRHSSSDEEMHLATALANLTASAITTSRIHEEQARIRQQSEFLAGASAVLNSSMNYEVTLATVTQLAVPRIADWCAIDIYEKGELHRVGIAHRDLTKVGLAREYRRLYPPDMGADSGVGAVVRTGQPQFFPHISDEMKGAYSRDERHRRILEDLGLQSFLITPLKVRDHVLGALTLVCAHRDMDFTDCQLADQLAQRAAIAIENAKLFGALKRSEEEARSLIENLPDVVARYGRDLRYAYMSPAAERLTGLPAKEFIGKRHNEIPLPEHLCRQFDDSLNRIFHSGRPDNIEFSLAGPDGEMRWLAGLGVPLFDADGRVENVLTITHDLTAFRKAEEAVERSEKELRLIMDILPALVAYIDPEEKFLRVNQAFEQWFGRPKEDIVGHSLLEVLGPNYPRIESQVKRALRGEFVQYETSNDYADRRRHVFITYVPDFDDQHRVRGFAALVQDVTERRAAEDALRKTEKLAAVGQLAASISHEINNPLESVTNLVYLARNAAELSEKTRGFLATAERELGRVSQIASQTLRFYRQSSRPSQVNLCELVDSVLGVFEGRINNAQVNIQRDYEEGPIQVEAIDGELRQVMANLVGNAVDATPAGGTIRIRISASRLPQHAHYARITIADTGSGISPQMRPRIFEPFFTTKSETGTGLGLWITREILSKHHGRIRVRSSQLPGRSGTAFCVFLPMKFAEAS